MIKEILLVFMINADGDVKISDRIFESVQECRMVHCSKDSVLINLLISYKKEHKHNGEKVVDKHLALWRKVI